MKLLFIYILLPIIVLFSFCCSSGPKLIAMNCILPYPGYMSRQTSTDLLSFLTWGNEIADEPPQIIGGIDSLINKIKYPEIARRSGIKGIVIVEFIIDSSGNATEIKIISGLDAGCDEIFIEALITQKYIPAKKNSKPVNQLMRSAVKFDLHYKYVEPAQI